MNHASSEVPMIGVVARPEDHDVVREFFELFKTPWEFYRRDRRYRVVLQADGTDGTSFAVSLPAARDREMVP